MLKLTIILVILIVLVFVGIKLASTPKSAEKGAPTTSSTQEGEDEDTSSTATAQPIETEPPEEEDPGTCETTGDWAMSGECQADGTAIFTQTYKESKPGACPSTEKARTKPCCYQKGDWTDKSECDQGGRKTQEQTTINCAENFKTRRVDCPYVGPWVKFGVCTPDGIQYYSRFVTNSGAEPNKSEKCCYTSDWSSWGGWSGCVGSRRSRIRTRTVVNCPTGTADKETITDNCGPCFSGDTSIKLENGNAINMEDVMIGDVLEGGVTVNATIQIRNIHKSPFYKILNSELNQYIYVTGSHMIKESGKFVNVRDSPKAEVSDVINDFFICLITDTHTIPIGEHTFWDWSDTCDVCETLTPPAT